MKNLTTLAGALLSAALFPAPLMAQHVLQDGDFENGLPNNDWNQWSAQSATLTGTYDPTSGTNLCARFGGIHHEFGLINQPVVQIQPQPTGLAFDIYTDSGEWCGGNYDTFGVTVFNTTTSQVVAYRHYELCLANNTSGWETHTLPIPPGSVAAANDVKVEFWISTDHSVVSTVYIDEIEFY